MPRPVREKSESGIYHIMLKGINKEKLFQNEKEKRFFLQLVQKYKIETGFELYAFCLMDTHVHLLIREQEETVSGIIQKISGTYAVWYNKKHERTGHLFQNRFKSKPVKDNTYFLTVLHYILYNPVNAGLCKRIDEFVYSSAKEYILGITGITDVYYAFRLTEKDDLRKFLKSTLTEKENTSLESRIPDEEAKTRIKTILGEISFEQLSEMKRYQLAEVIPRLQETGVSLRQISRITGLGMSRIRNFK